ncbi:hydroxyacylglutathione hydrolase [Aestuariirhabdus sp. LZHN29]|uniref:hydroxyacylglutathione hydrolase n=1 Tax=Aestuariirhabdus sp. LZHN29 TaxID=3417462 RepID=UPI003CF3C8BA
MLSLTAVPAFNDNYIWVLSKDGCGWVVDPGDAAPVLNYLENNNLTLEGVLVTHHHPDHTGGIARLLSQYPELEVVGPNNPRIGSVSRKVSEGDTLELLGCAFKVIATPGHTLDHLCYFSIPNGDTPLLFCGDTLFAGGCGRLFEGTAAQMHHSLQKLAQLPVDTRVCAAHEYTLANLAFAIAVEPDNSELQQRLQRCQQQRQNNLPTLPSSLQEELDSNPFLRIGEPTIVDAACAQEQHPVSGEETIFAAIRSWKDRF